MMKKSISIFLTFLMLEGIIGSIQINAEETNEKIVPYADIWATSVYNINPENHTADKAFDGDEGTYYISGYYPNGMQSLTAEFEGLTEIERIEFKVCGSDVSYRKNFDIYLSKTPDFSEAQKVYNTSGEDIGTGWISIDINSSNKFGYIRFIKNDSNGTNLGFAEIRIYSSNGRIVKNIIKNSSITATSTYPGETVDNISDCKTGTQWASGYYPNGKQTLTIQLDQIRTIDEILFMPSQYGITYRKNFDIYISKNADFSDAVKVFSVDGENAVSSGWTSVSLNGEYECKYIRFIKNDGNGTNLGFTEIMIYPYINITSGNIVKIYVSPEGSDENDGSQENPLKTIQAAQSVARQLTGWDMQSDIEIIIGEGEYELSQPLRFTMEDSGKNGYKVKYIGIGYPLVSAGKRITNFEYAGSGIWKTTVAGIDTMRELYVNDRRVYRASTEREITGMGAYNSFAGMYIDRNLVDKYANPEDMEVRWSVGWKGLSNPVDNIMVNARNKNQVIMTLRGPNYSIIAQNDVHRAGWDRAFRLENAFELLDQPGEYYYNKKTKELFYMPQKDEDMNTAVVYAPVHERIFTINGTESDPCSNIEFEGIRFAHSTYIAPEKFGYNHGQSCVNTIGDSYDELVTPCAIEISNAEDITIKNCVIYGTGAGAISAKYNVSNLDITGNAIYDTGESGIIIGRPDQSSVSVTEPNNYYTNMVKRSKLELINAQSYLIGWYNMCDGNINTSFSPSTNIKNQILFDFEKAVTINNIKIVFPSSAESARKSNFEILLSNDKTFATYETVLSVGSNSENELTVSSLPGEKYKYCMLRKKNASDIFSIAELELNTHDIAWEKKDVCKNINISNNVIKRVCNYYYGGAGIAMFFCDGLTIEHNDISYTPYSGISVGWAWHNNETTCKNTKILNNNISNYTMKSYDGGAIYILGRQPGSIIKGNYIENEGGPYGAIYFDIGASSFTASENVIVNSSYPIFLRNEQQSDNTITETYANTTNFLTLGTTNSCEKMKTFIPGNPPAKAKSIMENAGVEDEYELIYNLIPENKAYYEREPADKYNAIADKFGLSFNSHKTNFLLTCANTMIQLDEEEHNYDQKARLELERAMDQVKKYDRKTDVDPKGQIQKAIRLENAIFAFENSYKPGENSGNTDIEAFLPEECDADIKIDKEEKTVDVYLDKGQNISDLRARVAVSAGAYIFPDFTKGVNLLHPVKTLVKNGSEYSWWIIRAHIMNAKSEEKCAWNNRAGNRFAIDENIISFERSDTPYMYRGKALNEIEFSAKADVLDRIYGMNIVFDSLNGELISDGLETNNSYFEIGVKKGYITLKRIDGEKTTIIYGTPYDTGALHGDVFLSSDYINIEDFNTYKIICDNYNGEKHVILNINEKNVFSVSYDTGLLNSMGYMGIYAPLSDMIIEPKNF